MKKNIRVFYLKFSVFGDEIFYIFEKACFRNGVFTYSFVLMEIYLALL